MKREDDGGNAEIDSTINIRISDMKGEFGFLGVLSGVDSSIMSRYLKGTVR
jgi:hypothetical protein